MRPLNRYVFLLLALLTPTCSYAYIGPGAGLSALGSVLAFVGIIVLLAVSFLWYPIKRLIKSKRSDSSPEHANSEPGSDQCSWSP